MDGITMLLVSALTPWLLERLKWVRWFPLMQPYAHWVNRATPIALAALVSAGVTISFDQMSGTLTIKGLIPSDILRGLLLWGVGSLTQHLTYERAKGAIEQSVERSMQD